MKENIGCQDCNKTTRIHMPNNNFLLNSLRRSQTSQRTEPHQKKHQFLAAMRLNLQGQISNELMAEMIEVITPLLESNHFEKATKILTFWLKTEEERAKALEEIANKECSVETNASPRHYQYFKTTWGIVLFFEELFTPEQLSNMPDCLCFDKLITKPIILALRKNLTSPAKMAQMPKPLLIYDILSKNGINALRSHTYTFDELASLPSGEHIKSVVSPCAQRAYREKVFTLEDIKTIPDDNVFDPIKHLLNEHGIQLLREKLITWNDIKRINLITAWLRYICTEWGFKAFEKKHITAKDLENSRVIKSLNALLTEDAITAYDKGYFTLQEAASKLNNDQIFAFTSQNGL